LDSKAKEVKLFQNPLEADMACGSDKIQLEVIELQANDILRDKLKEGLFPVFPSSCIRMTFLMPKLLHHGFLSFFGTKYLYKHTF